MNGVIAPRDLQSALDAQSMLRDKTVDFNEALRCLKIAYKVSSSFKDILNEYASPKKSQTSKLGELLIESGLVTYEVLARAVEQSNSTCLPLGRMLVLHQTLTNEILTFALDLQVRVRDEMITREEAIAALRKAAGLEPQASVGADPAQNDKQASASTQSDDGERADALAMQRLKDGPRKLGLRLGELMVMAGVLTETDVMNALEWGLVNHQPMGKVLLTQKLVSEPTLDAALAIQKMVDKDNLEPVKASELLARVHSSAISLDDAVAEMKAEEEGSEKEITYERLLTLARVLDEDELEDAFDIKSKSSAIIGKVLVLTGHMDVPTLQATLRCHQLLSRGHLTPDDAVVTLDYCLHHNPDGPMKLDDALKELGWSKDKGLRLSGEPQPAPGTQAAVLDAVPVQSAFAPIPEQIAAIPEADAGVDISGAGLSQDSPAAPGPQIRHSETIQPEDARATRLAAILKGQKESDSALLANFDPSQQPPDALQNVFERLAHSYFVRGDYPQAQVIYERILVHRLNQIGPQDSALFTDLNNLAGVLIAQEHFAQAEPFMRRALKLLESAPSADPRRVADALSSLATIYFRQDKAREAEPLLRRALTLRREHAVSNPELAQTLSDLAKVLRRLQLNQEAEAMYQESLAMLSQIDTETGTGEFESV